MLFQFVQACSRSSGCENTGEDLDHLLAQLPELAEKCLDDKADKSDFIQGFGECICKLRDAMNGEVSEELSKFESIKTHASTKGMLVTVFVSTCLITLTKFLQKTFSSREYWNMAHNSAMRAWSSLESQGKIAQCLGYAQKMSGYLMETFKQYLVLAIKANGLDMPDEDKEKLSSLLDRVMDEMIK